MKTNNNPWKDIAPYKEEDAASFKGRSEDVAKYMGILSHSKFSVLYAESGIGKTSFLNAGIIPAYKKENADYYFIRVEFPLEVLVQTSDGAGQDIEEWLCEKIFVKSGLEEVEVELDEHFAALHKEFSNTLWWRLYAVKYKVVVDGKERIVRPFIIFDQFEEVFQKANSNLQNILFGVLDACSSSLPPQKLLERLQDESYYDVAEEVLENPNDFKMLFSLRKEYLAEFDYWTNDRYSNPELLRNRMILLPFSKEQATEVIEKQTINGKKVDTLSPVRNEILAMFSSQKGADGMMLRKDVGYEPFLLSVICSRLYDYSVNNSKQELLPADVEKLNILTIISDFYKETIRSLSIPKRHLRIIEEVLVDDLGERCRVNLRTASLKAIRFTERYKDKLEAKHIIKVQDGYVELIHDRIAEAVFDRRKKRENSQLLLLQRMILVAVIIFAAVAALWEGWSFSSESISYNEIYNNGVYREFKSPTEIEITTFREPIEYADSLIIDNDIIPSGRTVYNRGMVKRIEVVGKETQKLNFGIARNKRLRTLVLSDSISEIPYNQIGENPSLHEIKLPAAIKKIDERNFEGMDSVEFVVPVQAQKYFVWENKILWNVVNKEIVYAQKNADTLLCFPEPLLGLATVEYRGRRFHNKRGCEPDIICKNDTIIKVRLYDNESLDLTKQYDSIRCIASGVFFNNQQLRSIKLPSRLKMIGARAFAKCRNLREVVFSDTLTSIGSEAFWGSGLHAVELPKQVYIGLWAFANCDSLRTVTLPDFITNVEIQQNDSVSFSTLFDGGFPQKKYVNVGIYDKLLDSQGFDGSVVNVFGTNQLHYADTSKGTLRVRNSSSLKELHLPYTNPIHISIDKLSLSELQKKQITLFVPWGCSKYFMEDPDFDGFNKIQEDSFGRRLKSQLLGMLDASLSYVNKFPILKIFLLGILLLEFLLVYKQAKHSMKGNPVIMAISCLVVFIFTWMSFYWLIYYVILELDFGTIKLRNNLGICIGHAVGIVLGNLIVRRLTRGVDMMLLFLKNVWIGLRIITKEDFCEIVLDYWNRLLLHIGYYRKWCIILIVATLIVIGGGAKCSSMQDAIKRIEVCEKVKKYKEVNLLLDKELSGWTFLLSPGEKAGLSQMLNKMAGDIGVSMVKVDTIIFNNPTLDSIDEMACSPDGKSLIVLDGGKSYLYDKDSLYFLEGVPKQWWDKISFSRDGKSVLFYENYGRDRVAVYNLSLNRLDIELEPKSYRYDISCCALNPDGSVLLISTDSIARAIDVASGDTIAVMKHCNKIRSAMFSPDARNVVLYSEESLYGQVTIWDTHNNYLQSAQKDKNVPFVLNDRLLFYNQQKYTVDDVEGKVVIKKWPIISYNDEISPKGKFIVDGFRNLKVINGRSTYELTLLKDLDVDKYFFHPNDDGIFAVDNGKLLRIYPLSLEEQIKRLSEQIGKNGK